MAKKTKAPKQDATTKEFVVQVKTPLLLIILPVLALVVFLVVVGINSGIIDSRAIGNVPFETYVYGGTAVMAVLLVAEMILLLQRAAEPEAVETALEPIPLVDKRDELGELVLTQDNHQGRQVVEYSRPPKSRNKGAIYVKTFIELDGKYVLRAEEMIAEEKQYL
ncbi:MAG: hypothetical protein HY556_10045 [Euryarchaeota archaeon]|nr:hypothetical protein [Euryarchaeota archaeon]